MFFSPMIFGNENFNNSLFFQRKFYYYFYINRISAIITFMLMNCLFYLSHILYTRKLLCSYAKI